MERIEPERPPVRQTLTDYLIKKAEEKGAFAQLPGAGKPLPGIDEPYDELWWAKELVKREELSPLLRDEARTCPNSPTSTFTSTR